MFEFMRSQINAKRCRSAWDKGVRLYALELIDSLEERAEWDDDLPTNSRQLDRWMLNGASSWQQYSEGGCALIYNRDIAERLCTASELRKTDNGRKAPNAFESWIDVQARALYQACVHVSIAWQAAQQILPTLSEADDDTDDEIPAF